MCQEATAKNARQIRIVAYGIAAMNGKPAATALQKAPQRLALWLRNGYLRGVADEQGTRLDGIACVIGAERVGANPARLVQRFREPDPRKVKVVVRPGLPQTRLANNGVVMPGEVTDALIVGAGPLGLTLALDPGRRGEHREPVIR